MARCPARWPSSTRRLLDAQPNLWTHTTITVGRSANETNRQIESALVEVHHQNFLLSLVQSKAYSIAIRRALFSAIAFPLHCRVIIAMVLPYSARRDWQRDCNIRMLVWRMYLAIHTDSPMQFERFTMNASYCFRRNASYWMLHIESFGLNASNWNSYGNSIHRSVQRHREKINWQVQLF